MNFVIAFSVVCVDQLSKFFIEKYLSVHRTIAVIPDIFHVSLVHNRGAAFGMLRNQLPLFILTAVVAIILIYTMLKNQSLRRVSSYSVALSLILGGAVGNLIDRIFLGYVIDFLDFRIWPVFNIADSAITVGAVIIGWHIIFVKQKAQA
ncbi:MAG TPA: signal peptidase II [Candidatus Omnitrophota bacterium]|nr:signal peptidase II [Candidatus Omnitrophota bacterium]HPT06869.1 signal peptidase II [Candidatus Omnitrophota bacterium]